MELDKALQLIMQAEINSTEKSCWTDLGCGNGLFTTALSHLLYKGSTIYAVDSNENALRRMQPSDTINIQKMKADFIHDDLPLAELDGIIMANSIHFVADKDLFINKIQQWLKAIGSILLVEYDMNSPNTWVPYPISFSSAMKLFGRLGFESFKKLGEQPSIYNRANMYAVQFKRSESPDQ